MQVRARARSENTIFGLKQTSQARASIYPIQIKQLQELNTGEKTRYKPCFLWSQSLLQQCTKHMRENVGVWMLTILKRQLDLTVTESCLTLLKRSFPGNFACYRFYTSALHDKKKSVYISLHKKGKIRISEIGARHLRLVTKSCNLHC
jgi:hypothetical protein